MSEKETILGLLRLGWSVRRVERETGRRHETIRRYGLEAGLLSQKPPAVVGPLANSKSRTSPEVPTDPQGGPATSSRSVCEAHRAFIEAEVGKGRNAMAIYQDLVEHHGYAAAYDAVKRFVRRLHVRNPKVSVRFETLPGQEAQVDYGEGAPTRDPKTGRYRKPRLFVMTLGNSRKSFRTTVWNSSKQTWCELHEAAFAHFGGVPETVRLDNLREGVIQPDIYDPELNALYAAMLAHYGVTALPCRPYAPDLKGKVESAVGHTQSTALKGKRFESLAEQNTFLLHWEERWASTRIHGTTKRQVREMFEEERKHLRPLPLQCFEYYRAVQRRVHFDGYIEVDGGYYSVPPRYAGSMIVAHVGTQFVRILDQHSRQLLREHPVVSKGGRRTDQADHPPQTPPPTAAIVAQIEALGPSIAAFARNVESERGIEAKRTLFGLLDLARRYDVRTLDAACALALAAHTCRLRFLRTYLQRHGTPVTLQSTHRVIPGFERYVTHFAALTKGASPQ